MTTFKKKGGVSVVHYLSPKQLINAIIVKNDLTCGQQTAQVKTTKPLRTTVESEWGDGHSMAAKLRHNRVLLVVEASFVLHFFTLVLSGWQGDHVLWMY